MMRIRLTAAITLAAATLLAVSSCSSGSSADAPSQPSVQSISLAPGVVKDSPADLNSTKDMSGVVDTTAQNPGQSPYYGHLPRVCPLLDKSTFDGIPSPNPQTGLDTEFSQNCIVQGQGQGFETDQLTVGILAQRLSGILENADTTIIQNSFSAPGIPTPVTSFSTGSSKIDGTCYVAWGTFYGTAEVFLSGQERTTSQNCPLALEYAKKVAPQLPKSPYQMRAAS